MAVKTASVPPIANRIYYTQLITVMAPERLPPLTPSDPPVDITMLTSTISIRRWLVPLSLFACMASDCLVLYADPQDGQPAVSEQDSSDQSATTPRQNVRILIQQLNDDKFAVRQAATTKLAELGKDVIPDLVAAAQGVHLEITTRALSLLDGFLTSNDAETTAAARNALEQLSSSEHKAASGGANDLLRKYEQEANSPERQFPLLQLQPAIGVQRGQFQIQIQGGLGGRVVRREIRRQQAGGVTTTKVIDDDTEIEIVEEPGKGIAMEVTTGNAGQRKTQKYKAKNAEELRKAHPEAHGLYQKYANNNALPGIRPRPAKPRPAPAPNAPADEGQDAPDKPPADQVQPPNQDQPPPQATERDELQEVRRTLQKLIKEVDPLLQNGQEEDQVEDID